MVLIKRVSSILFLLVAVIVQTGTAAEVTVSTPEGLEDAIREARPGEETRIRLASDIEVGNLNRSFAIGPGRHIILTSVGEKKRLAFSLPLLFQVQSSDIVRAKIPGQVSAILQATKAALEPTCFPLLEPVMARDTTVLGDVDGDGFQDLAYSVQSDGRWTLQIVLGGPAPMAFPSRASATVLSLAPGLTLRSVNPLGDINGDGLNDFAVSYSRDMSVQKGVYVTLGSPNLREQRSIALSDPDELICEAQTLVPVNPTSFSAITVAHAGDIDGDGLSDFVLGVPPYVYFMFGGRGFESRTLRVDQSRAPVVQGSRNDFGGALASGADFNGDGMPDVAIGSSSGSEITVLLQAKAFKPLFEQSQLLRANVENVPRITFVGGSVAPNCGRSLIMKDLDNDGLGDIVVYCGTAATNVATKLFVVFGRKNWPLNGRFNLTDVGLELILPQRARIASVDVDSCDADGDGFVDLILRDASQAYLARSPGRLRSALHSTQGAFVIEDNASLEFQSVDVVTPGPRLFSSKGNGARAHFHDTSRVRSSEQDGELRCPAALDVRSGSEVCPSCSNPDADGCERPCSDMIGSVILQSAPTRLETNLESFKVVELDDGKVVVVRFDPTFKRVLASIFSPLDSNRCVVQKDILVTNRAAVYVVDANNEAAARYSGSMALFMDVVRSGRTSFTVVFLGEDNIVYARDWMGSLSAFGPLRSVISLRSFSPIPPVRSSAVVVKSCASSSLEGRSGCFLGYFLLQTFTYVAVAFNPDGSASNILSDTAEFYPLNQLELYTIASSADGKTVSGEGHYVSTMAREKFIVVYMQRDAITDWVDESYLRLSVFRSSDMATLVDGALIDNPVDLFVRMAITTDPSTDDVFLAAQLMNLNGIRLYQFIHNGNTFTRISISPIFINPPLALGMDLTVLPNGRLGLFLTSRGTGRTFASIDPRNTADSIILDSDSSSNLYESPMTTFRSAWILPRNGLVLKTTVTADPLSDMRQGLPPDQWPFAAKINAFLDEYPEAGFPLTLNLELHKLAIPRNLSVLPCPLGHYCAMGEVSPCPSGSYQTNHPMNSIGDCESNNPCEPGFFCGRGAAQEGSYRKLIEPSLSAIDVQVFAGAQRDLLLTWRNTDSQGRLLRLALRSPLPPWLRMHSTSSLLSAFEVGEDTEMIVHGDGTALGLNITVDSSKAPSVNDATLTTNLTWEWWIGQSPDERFLFQMPVSVQVVPVLLVPRTFNFTLPEEGPDSVTTGEVVLYNTFPSNEIRARAFRGCEGHDAPDWLRLDEEASNVEAVLAPGLGGRFALRFSINATAAHPALLGPLLPAKVLGTCIRFNCTIDGNVNIVETVNIALVVVQNCPKDHFSPASGANTVDRPCLPCSSDSFQPALGSIECIPASKCPRGTYSVQSGLRFNDTSCVPCPSGSYQPLEGSASCLSCPRGFYNNREGAFECFECPDQLQGGNKMGAKSITECESSPGYYKVVHAEMNRVEAVMCPEGTNCSEPSDLSRLPVSPGYWRASLNSSIILPCRRSHYCGGIRTTWENATSSRRRLQDVDDDGSDAYCRDNHSGVMCEKCPPGFAKRGVDRVCTECNDTISRLDNGASAGILIAVLLVPTICTGALVWYQRRSRKGGLKATSKIWTVMRLADGGTKPKLIIGLFQVVAACVSNFRFSFPPTFSNVAEGFSIFYVDAMSVIDLGCALRIAPESFWKSLLVSTIAPIIALSAIALVSALVIRFAVEPSDDATRKQVRTVGAAMMLFTLFLVYPGVSNTVIKTFICERFDDGRVVLEADYAVPCYDSVWRGYAVFAGFMIVVYVIGIPAFIFCLMYRYRRELNPNKSGPYLDRRAQEAIQIRDSLPETKWLFFLVHAYLPFYSWFEPLDLIVRLMQTSVVLAFTQTWAQILFLCCVTIAYLVVLVQLAPYVKRTNHILAFLCQVAILCLGLISLVFTLNREKVNVTAMDVICFIALFGPLAVAIPLHIIQIRIARWKGFFDAQEPRETQEKKRRYYAAVAAGLAYETVHKKEPASEPSRILPQASIDSFVASALNTNGEAAHRNDNADLTRILPVGDSSLHDGRSNAAHPIEEEAEDFAYKTEEHSAEMSSSHDGVNPTTDNLSEFSSREASVTRSSLATTSYCKMNDPTHEETETRLDQV